MDFIKMTAAERQEHYESEFGKKNEPLRHFELPAQDSEHPQIVAEVNAAYLRHTIFTVEVWSVTLRGAR